MIITDADFDSAISQHRVILVDFWAEWCGPCKMMSPVLDDVSSETGLWVGKINIDENPVKTSEYKISSIPNMVLFVNGKPVKSIIGAMPKHKLMEEIKEWI